MKLHGRGDWTRAKRAKVAADLAGVIVTEQNLTRIRSLAHLIRKVLCESGDMLDLLVQRYPALEPGALASPAPPKVRKSSVSKKSKASN